MREYILRRGCGEWQFTAYGLPDWPSSHWDRQLIADQLAAVRHRQGRLVGRMEALGFSQRTEAQLETLTQDVLKSTRSKANSSALDQVARILAPISVRFRRPRARRPARRGHRGMSSMRAEIRRTVESGAPSLRAAIFPRARGHAAIGAWTDEAQKDGCASSGTGRAGTRSFERRPRVSRTRDEALHFDWSTTTRTAVLQMRRALVVGAGNHPIASACGRSPPTIACDLSPLEQHRLQSHIACRSSGVRRRNSHYDCWK